MASGLAVAGGFTLDCRRRGRRLPRRPVLALEPITPASVSPEEAGPPVGPDADADAANPGDADADADAVPWLSWAVT